MVRRLAIAAMVALVGCGTPAPAPVARPPVPIAFVSPGPLTAVHGSLVCGDCHAGETPQVTNDRCLGCHEHGDLRARITAGRGLHASASVRGKACMACHQDHKGLRFDSLGWKTIQGGKAGFDHDLAGWPLSRPHATVACESCHRAKNRLGGSTYLGADRLCGACHQNQPHGLDRRDLLACERCHDEAVWSPPKRMFEFDHDDRKDAAMPLRGRHRDLVCSACHPAGQFNSPAPKPTECSTCHRSPHAGTIYAATACSDCHGLSTFATIDGFDHSERTKFELGASHRHVTCESCHTKALGAKSPSSACESCHAARAPHKDRFKAFGAPPACGLCHAPSTPFDPKVGTRLPWRATRFSHGANTKWPLWGKHAQATCRACHRGAKPTEFERFADGDACMGCHEHKGVHATADRPNGQFTNAQCTFCHR